ncbi:MAG: iron-containing alcohol dehydrogenase [Lachnospiraceae bacterium]|nr:iron-containing alcohol dehydrogenase [Lachnospiraceae bacterium]
MSLFSFSVPQNITFGIGALDKIPDTVCKMKATKAFIVSGPHLYKAGLVDRIASKLKEAGIESISFTETEGNPSTDTVEKAAALFKEFGADMIVAFGGGSPLDVAKAVAVIGSYGGKITDYEGVGKVPGPVVPMLAIPTTAGTGSEVTSFSVITDHSRNYKLTVGSTYLLPEAVILDPELIYTVPEKTASYCGVDAMIHALESYISLASSSFSDMCAIQALELLGKNIRAYVADRKNADAAEGMLLGSLYAGIAFSHARLGNVHAMSHPVSAFFDVPHGLANAVLLPVVVEFNAVEDTGKYYEIYKRIARNPVSKDTFRSGMLVNEIRSLNEELGIPSLLRKVGVDERKIEAMAEDAMKSGNIAVNPRKTTIDDIIKLYRTAY